MAYPDDPIETVQAETSGFVGSPAGYRPKVIHPRESDAPIYDQVPIPDAIEQRQPVGPTPELSEDFRPTEVSEIGDHAPDEANPADWQEQLTSADAGDEQWHPDIA